MEGEQEGGSLSLKKVLVRKQKTSPENNGGRPGRGADTTSSRIGWISDDPDKEGKPCGRKNFLIPRLSGKRWKSFLNTRYIAAPAGALFQGTKAERGVLRPLSTHL